MASYELYDAENRLIEVQGIDPLAAACDTTLPFTTGGDAEWFAQTSEYSAACPEPAEWDGDAAQSGAIATNESTWLEATVEGPGTVSLDYKLSSATGDSLNFFVDAPHKWDVPRDHGVVTRYRAADVSSRSLPL